MKRQTSKTNRRAGGARNGGGTAFPGPLSATVQVDKVIRFKAATAMSAAVVAITDLLDLFCVATSATAAYQLPSAVKLRRIEMWAPPASDSSSVVLSIEDVVSASGVGGPSRIKEDVSMGATRPAHVTWKPAPGSTQSMWGSTVVSGALVEITGPAGTVIDVHLSWVLQDGESPLTVSGVVAGATVGRVYIRSLNSTTSLTQIPPVSFPTI